MKAKDYYPTYIPRKWIHFAEHGRKYRIRKKYPQPDPANRKQPPLRF